MIKKPIHLIAGMAAFQLACVASGIAATAGLGTDVPSAGDGVQNLNFSTSTANNTNVQFVPSEYLAGDNTNKLGQSFTTGSNAGGYSLTSISVRQVSWGTTFWDYTGGNVTVKVFSMDSNANGVWNVTQLALETAIVGGEPDGIGLSSGAPGANAQWLTVTFDTPVVLPPDTQFGFMLASDGTGGNDGFFMEIDGTNTSTFTGGFALTTGNINGTTVWDGNNGQPSDRAFVATMTELAEPVPPAFLTQPQWHVGDVGDTVTLTATANGSPVPTYQWEYSPDGVLAYTDVVDGGSVSGAATKTLTFDPAEFSHNGFYRVVASNAGGSATSGEAQVDLIYPDPVISTQPVGGAVQVGSNVSLTVAATGLGTLSYQWHGDSGMLSDGGSISGSNTPTLTLSNVQLSESGSYYCEVTDHKATEDASGESDAVAFSNDAMLDVFVTNSGLVSFEPFIAYPMGVELEEQNPSIAGYLDPWANAGVFGQITPITSAGSLAYGGAGYVAGIGGKVGVVADTGGILQANSGRVERLLEPNLKGSAVSSQTLYLSWLFQTGNEGSGTLPNNYQILGLWNGPSGTDSLRVFEAGIAVTEFSTANYGFRVNGSTGTRVNLGVAPDANVHLFVAKIALSPNANSDSITVWIDPSLGAGEPTGGALVAGINLAFDRLVISDYAGNSSNWDEIRWGSTFDSVTVTAPSVPLIPEFTLQPTSQSGIVGGSVTLTGVAEGDPAPDYQWQFDGGSGYTDLLGETGESLVLQPATYSQNGMYRLVASNVNGETTSDEVFASLSYPVPVITQQPQPVAGLAGSNVSLSVTATSLGNLSYQWFMVNAGGDIPLSDGGNITGATTSSLQVSSLTTANDGQYYAIVSDDAAVVDEGQPKQSASGSARITVADLSLTSGTTAPTTDEFDQFYLPGAVAKASNVNGGGDASTYIAFDRASKGMSFTTGSDPLGYSLGSITVQHVSHAGTAFNVQNMDTFDFNFGILSGTTKTVLYQTSKAAYLGDPLAGINITGTGRFFTFDLSGSGVGTLSPNTTYYFEITTETGDPFFEWNGTSADGYAGGTAFGGTTVAIIDETFTAMTGDRAFHADLTGLSGPADDYASWIAGYPGVGAMTGFNDDPDGDGIKNGLENFFGTDPSVANQGITMIAKNGSIFTFQHPQNPTPASDVDAAYRWTLDLNTWHANGATSGGATVNFATQLDTPTPGVTTVTATISGTVPAKFFSNLEVVQGAP